MCDSWTDPMGMSIIKFIVYCNSVIFFHKIVDCIRHNQDANYVFGVTWEDYKANLLATRRIALMSTVECHMAYYTWMMPH
jgi:hypothetical protein